MKVISSNFSAVRNPLTELDLCVWINQAAPGDFVEYHRGFLAIDTIPRWTPLTERDRVELCRVAQRARWLADQRLVHLVQRRHGADDYGYLAVARRKPRASASLSSLILAEVA